MNLILFEPDELASSLPFTDARARHLIEILKLAPGDRFVAGVVNGLHGTLGWLSESPEGLVFGEADFNQSPTPLLPIHLLIGTPRPPTARRLLKDLTTLGACELHFVATDLGDKSYLQSNLWNDEWRGALQEGASQNRSTLLPRVERHERLAAFIKTIASPRRVWFDEGGTVWSRHPLLAGEGPLWLAIGPERGWSAKERDLFEAQGWSKSSLGSSILRTETACALALGLAAMELSAGLTSG